MDKRMKKQRLAEVFPIRPVTDASVQSVVEQIKEQVETGLVSDIAVVMVKRNGTTYLVHANKCDRISLLGGLSRITHVINSEAGA